MQISNGLKRIALDKYLYLSIIGGTALAVGLEGANLGAGLLLGLLTAVGYLTVDRIQAKRMTGDWYGQPEDVVDSVGGSDR